MESREHPQNPLFPLPDEICLAILGFVQWEDLIRPALACKDGLRLATVEHERRHVNEYKAALADTSMWQYLHLLLQEDRESIEGKRFTDYLATIIGCIPPAHRAEVRTFAQFMQTATRSLWVRQLPSDFLEKFPITSKVAGKILENYHPESDSMNATGEENPQALIKFRKLSQ